MTNSALLVIILSCVGHLSAIRNIADEVEDTLGTSGVDPQFLEMTPMQLLKYKKTVCGKSWPTKCTQDTDGFLCNSKDGTINDMTIYKNVFKGEDAGPSDADFQGRARCVSGQCQKDMINMNGVEIKKISEIGAHICATGLSEKKDVKIKVTDETGKETEHTVDVEIIASKTDKAEDISVELKIPLAAVEFNTATTQDGVMSDEQKAKGATFKNEDSAKAAIKGAIQAIGMLETATQGKVCAHGFTVASQESLDTMAEMVKGITLARAEKIGQVALDALSDNPRITDFEAVAHMQHVDEACGGLVIKLNGAAADECKTDDWEGKPL